MPLPPQPHEALTPQPGSQAPITVGDFFAAGRDDLALSILDGQEHFDTVIPEQSLNRPGLALAGFMQYFACRRIQVMGLAETAYLKSLPAAARERRVAAVCRQHIPAIVMSRNRHAPDEVQAAARRHKIPLLKTSMITSRFLNLATILLERLAAPKLRYQGTMVDIFGIGVLLEGKPGIGKSETALTLIERGHSLVADDITLLCKSDTGGIVGSALEITRYHMEIRGLGIVHVPSLFGVAAMRKDMRLDMIIMLHEMHPELENDRTGLAQEKRDILGVPIPFIRLPVAPGRDMANVIEAAALNQKLKLLGHDAAKELDERLVASLSQRRPGRP